MKYITLVAAVFAGMSIAQDLELLKGIPPCGVSGANYHNHPSMDANCTSNLVSPRCWEKQSLWDVQVLISNVSAQTKILEMASMTVHMNPALATQTRKA